MVIVNGLEDYQDVNFQIVLVNVIQEDSASVKNIIQNIFVQRRL